MSQKYQTLSVPVTQNIEMLTHALSCITIIFIPDKEPKYRTGQIVFTMLVGVCSKEAGQLWL